jgi:hypothetical protein
VNIREPNFEQALIDEGIDTDGIINGLFSPSNAIGVSSLMINGLNISDLTGIEAFTDLETLFAIDNNLSTVDLSANVALDGLVLGNNNLTYIDLSNNVNLVSVVLAGNQLTNLDLTNNPLITQVFIQDNLFTEFDASILPNLTQLNVSQNDLTLLDLSQNPNLNQLFASDNNLISLNLQNGNNTAIPSSFFDTTQNEFLTCIQVDDVNYSTSTWDLIDSQSFFNLDCLPTNDDCSFATPITIGNTFSGSSNSSTPSGTNPNCQQTGVVVFDVWYEFIAPASGSINLSIDATPLIGRAAVYENCTDQMPIACATDTIQLDNLNPGQVYYAQVWLELNTNGLLSQTENTAVGDFTILIDEVLSNTNFEESLKFNFYPNPAQEYIRITSKDIIESFEIYDINGKAVLTQQDFNSTERQIDISKLSTGTYLLKVSSNNSTSTQKLIIK